MACKVTAKTAIGCPAAGETMAENKWDKGWRSLIESFSIYKHSRNWSDLRYHIHIYLVQILEKPRFDAFIRAKISSRLRETKAALIPIA